MDKRLKEGARPSAAHSGPAAAGGRGKEATGRSGGAEADGAAACCRGSRTGENQRGVNAADSAPPQSVAKRDSTCSWPAENSQPIPGPSRDAAATAQAGSLTRSLPVQSCRRVQRGRPPRRPAVGNPPPCSRDDRGTPENRRPESCMPGASGGTPPGCRSRRRLPPVFRGASPESRASPAGETSRCGASTPSSSTAPGAWRRTACRSRPVADDRPSPPAKEPPGRPAAARGRLSQQPAGKHVIEPERLQGVEQDDIEVTGEAAVLKAVVEHNQLAAEPCDGLAGADRRSGFSTCGVSGSRRCNSRASSFSRPDGAPYPRLTTPDAAPARLEPADQPLDQRGLARATQRKITDANDRHACPVHPRSTAVEAPVPQADGHRVAAFAQPQDAAEHGCPHASPPAADELLELRRAKKQHRRYCTGTGTGGGGGSSRRGLSDSAALGGPRCRPTANRLAPAPAAEECLPTSPGGPAPDSNSIGASGTWMGHRLTGPARSTSGLARMRGRLGICLHG